jgi:hypothetical protein
MQSNSDMSSGRARAPSNNDHNLMSESEISIEDLTVMKLMEEIMEFD